MPSAHEAVDGEIAATVSAMRDTQRINISFQVLPWLEGSFRYSHLADFGTTGSYYDRSFGMKLRLMQETEYLPDFSMGIRDLIGTGVYGSEYFVASKHIWQFDVTGGLGWGRLADDNTFPNPFAKIFPSFAVRQPFGGTGGQVDFSNFFHGHAMGVFGGLSWETPIDGLDILAEYSSDHYIREVASGNMVWRSPGNFGLSYRPISNAILSAGWLYGSTWGASLTITIDPKKPVFPFRIGPIAPPPAIRTQSEKEKALTNLTSLNAQKLVPQNEATQTLKQALMSQAPDVRDFALEGRTLLVYVNTPQKAEAPCETYARIAGGVHPGIQTVAVSNLDDPEGRVSVCQMGIGVPLGHQAATDGAANVSMPANDAEALTKKIRDDSKQQGIRIEAIKFGAADVLIYYQNTKFFSEAQAAGRIARVLMADAPPAIEVFRLILVAHGVPQREFKLARSALERAAGDYGGASELGDAVSIDRPALSNPVFDEGVAGTYPRYFWALTPQIHQSAFDPNAPYQVQFLASGIAGVDLLPGLTLSTKLDGNIWNNFDTSRISNSQLPHVRSDINEYYKYGSSGVSDMMVTWRTRLSPDLYGEVKAGILEDMFAGAGGQLLWRPEDSRFSFGADIYQVWQRGFDRLFDLHPYNVVTGHISAYYQSPWYGLNFNIHAGRYLAGDYGATFEMTRRFSTGVEIGAYATFTNVPFSKFGEGGFDKGLIMRIPVEWMLPTFSNSVFDLTLRSLARDGGQRLNYDDSLYDETIGSSYGEIQGHLDDITRP